MSKGPDWEKVAREDRMRFVPSAMAEPATQRQLDYILGLAQQKNQVVRLPKTKRGAGELIDRLSAMADINDPVWYRNGRPTGHWEDRVEVADDRKELLAEIRESFPQLSPMTIASLVQLFSQIDEMGMVFTFDALMHEEVPTDSTDLILHLLRRFLAEFSEVTDDDTTLAAG